MPREFEGFTVDTTNLASFELLLCIAWYGYSMVTVKFDQNCMATFYKLKKSQAKINPKLTKTHWFDGMHPFV